MTTRLLPIIRPISNDSNSCTEYNSSKKSSLIESSKETSNIKKCVEILMALPSTFLDWGREENDVRMLLECVEDEKKSKLDNFLLQKCSKWRKLAYICLCILSRFDEMDVMEQEINKKLFLSCLSQNIDSVKHVMKDASDWNMGLRGACSTGNVDLVKLMLSKGATDLQNSLLRACKSGSIPVIELLIKKGANDWNMGL